MDVDFAERGGIKDAGRVADGQALAVNCLVHGFLALGEVPGAFPLADIFEDRAVAFRPFVGGGAADDIEELTAAVADQRAEGDRRVGRAEGGGADLGNRPVQGIGDDGEGVHIAGFALIGAHAGCGVAFDMFDRAKAFAQGQFEVFAGHIILEIDEGTLARPVGWTLPAGRDVVGRVVADAWRCDAAAARADGFIQAGGMVEGAIGGAHGSDAVMRAFGFEGRDRIIEVKFAAALGEQPGVGVPAAGHPQHIGGDWPGLAG